MKRVNVLLTFILLSAGMPYAYGQGLISRSKKQEITIAKPKKSNKKILGTDKSPILEKPTVPVDVIIKKGQEEEAKNDFYEAIKWYRLAAEQGDADGQYHLGRMYEYGRGTSKSDYEAVLWYSAAAKQDNAQAQLELGGRYKRGDGVIQDFTQAAQLFQKAAEQGNVTAQTLLSIMYAKGEGVTKNVDEALKWGSIADKNGDPIVIWNLARIYRESEEYADAMKCYHILADKGDAEAQFEIGYMYVTGRGVPKDYTIGIDWYRKAAENGSSNAQNSLGYMYMQGVGVIQDYGEARKWLEKAASQGNLQAKTYLDKIPKQ
ncbi:MAG: sel1 repeat family protein [Bacteroides sp.]|nr:sel1 repeat family protein [Bacteroides sp.]